jgi:ribonuclease BN (tRNA processing enzyme)
MVIVLQIKVLGTRGEIESSAPYHTRQSGVLIDNVLLFDIGEEEYLKYNPDQIFITHLHPDHAFFMRDSYNKEIHFSMPIYAPEKYNQKIKKCNKEIKIGNSYSIIPLPTHHSKKVKSNAYLIKKNDQSILYTGDLIWINKKYHHLFNNVNLVITEASFIRKEGRIQKDKETGRIYGHAGVPRLINLFKDYTKNILFVHFGEWFFENTQQARKQINSIGKKNNINTLIGYDGLEFDLKEIS